MRWENASSGQDSSLVWLEYTQPALPSLRHTSRLPTPFHTFHQSTRASNAIERLGDLRLVLRVPRCEVPQRHDGRALARRDRRVLRRRFWEYMRQGYQSLGIHIFMMYVCMYIRMYVLTYVCMYVCTYVCMYTCMYTYMIPYVEDTWPDPLVHNKLFSEIQSQRKT